MFEVDVKKHDGEGEKGRRRGPALVWGSDTALYCIVIYCTVLYSPVLLFIHHERGSSC